MLLTPQEFGKNSARVWAWIAQAVSLTICEELY